MFAIILNHIKMTRKATNVSVCWIHFIKIVCSANEFLGKTLVDMPERRLSSIVYIRQKTVNYHKFFHFIILVSFPFVDIHCSKCSIWFAFALVETTDKWVFNWNNCLKTEPEHGKFANNCSVVPLKSFHVNCSQLRMWWNILAVSNQI